MPGLADRAAARLHTFLEAAPDAILVVRRNGIISFANLRVAAIFRCAIPELIGRSIDDFIPERFRPRHRGYVAAFFAAPVMREMDTGFDLFAQRKDGTEFMVEVSLSPIEFEGEQKVMASVRDVTARKQLEADVETSRAQVLASARLSALGTMAGGIAHEVNNPLGVIHALASDLAELAEQGEVPREEVADGTRQIVQYADRIARIVKSLRLIARDGTRDAFETASVGDIVAHALDLCMERFRGHSVALLTDPVDPDLRIACREVQISQILTNLLQNAFDAALEQPGEKWVRLSVAASPDHVEFAVSDSGNGVPMELKERIMEAFFTTKAVGKGTGLGLSLSRQIAEEHGGTLTLDDSTGHTCFRLCVPFHPSR